MTKMMQLPIFPEPCMLYIVGCSEYMKKKARFVQKFETSP